MQPHYRNYSQQAAQRSPHGAHQRRGGIGPMVSSGSHHTVPMTQAQIQQQQQAQAHANELARRRSRKPTDKNLPEGIEDSIIDPEAVQRYRRLRDVERELDATITRKRLDLSETSRVTSKLSRTLRIWISNTAEDQVWQGNGLNVDAFDFSPNLEASYRVKIEGSLLDTTDDIAGQLPTDDTNGSSNPSQGLDETVHDPEKHLDRSSRAAGLTTSSYRFSHFFKALRVDFDDSRLRNGADQAVEWKKPEPVSKSQSGAMNAASDFDEITFKRDGDENINITVNLYRQEFPERYQLSPELAEVVDMTEATQAEAVTALWEYIRLWSLQEDEEKRNFRCDDLLKRVVGRGEIGYIPMLNEYVTQHLRPLPPIKLPYTIRTDEDFHKDPQPTIYDLQVSVDDPFRSLLHPLVNNNSQFASTLKDVAQLDEQLARLIQATALSRAKYSFFTSLSENPAAFVRNWLSSQKRDVEVILGRNTNNGNDTLSADEWRRGGSNSVWSTQNARESVNVLLSRQR